ncbi:MAG: CYTH domain-containing protein [Vulcanococcus sp.]
MALEIERRFLVRGEGWRQHSLWSQPLVQGYLPGSAQGMTLRVRRGGAGEAWLTLKFPGEGIARHEFEYAIPEADAEPLLDRCTAVLSKCRHGLNLPGGEWVLDVFEGPNSPLVIAEVELEQADQAIEIPAWCVQEITGLATFSNAALSAEPFAHWPLPEQERWRACLSG